MSRAQFAQQLGLLISSPAHWSCWSSRRSLFYPGSGIWARTIGSRVLCSTFSHSQPLGSIAHFELLDMQASQLPISQRAWQCLSAGSWSGSMYSSSRPTSIEEKIWRWDSRFWRWMWNKTYTILSTRIRRSEGIWLKRMLSPGYISIIDAFDVLEVFIGGADGLDRGLQSHILGSESGTGITGAVDFSSLGIWIGLCPHWWSIAFTMYRELIYI